MKSHMTLMEMAQELRRQQQAKKDYLATETALHTTWRVRSPAIGWSIPSVYY